LALSRYPLLTITIDILRTAEALEEIAEEWQALIAGTEGESFSSPWWYLAWLDAFPVDALAIVIARDGERLVGVLPMGRTRTDWRGMYFPRISPFARGDFQPPIMAVERTAELLPRMLDAARDTLGRRHAVWWPNLPQDSIGLKVLREYCRDHGMPTLEIEDIAPRLPIAQRSMAAIEKEWSASHRGDVRRQRRRLEATGPLHLWEPPSISEGLLALEEFFDVHDAKWLQQGYPGRFDDPRNRAHFRAAFTRMFGKGAHFSILRVGEDNVSYIFGFFAGGWLQVYRPTFKLEFSNLSPSKVHLGLLLERGCEANWHGIDFLLGAEPYKLQWCGAEQVVVKELYAGASSHSPAFLWYGSLRPWLHGRYAGKLLRAKARLKNWTSAT